jgi:alpha-L-fucosidase 2
MILPSLANAKANLCLKWPTIKKYLLIINCAVFATLALRNEALAQQKPMLLWYDKPAHQPTVFSYKAKEFTNTFHFEKKGWFEALPVGNGRLGAMVFGGVFSERIQLNEESLWDGYPRDATNPLSGKSLAEVQRLMFEGKNDEAEQLAARTMMGVPLTIQPYQSLGDLFIEELNKPTDTLYTNYRRWLSLDSAVAVTKFSRQGVNYRREIFASHPTNSIIVKIVCDKPNGLNLRIRLTREQDATVSASATDPASTVMKGRIHCLNEKTGEPVGMNFASHIKAVATQGKISVAPDGMMTITNATEVVLHITGSTSYGGNDPEATCTKIINQTHQQPTAKLFNDHLKDYQSLYNRVTINLDKGSSPYEGPLDERIARVKKSGYEDTYLSELLFHYGRYLLIASSRPGDLPANLQGLWNQSMRPPWSSDYHTNINLQMNYMAAEAVNLQECTLPLFALMDSLAKHGQRTAQIMYNARGWVVHHLTDVFWRTSPVDGVVGVWPMGGGWLAHHPFDHYLFSGDKNFLKERAYPLMKGAAQFYLDFLKPIPAGLPNAGKLVTNPSHSPENAFEKPDGSQFQFTYGASMDMQICHQLFSNCLRAIADLSTQKKPFDAAFKVELEKALASMSPIKISPATGGIQEWVEDYKEPEIGHRHISHLYALFPSNQINVKTPALYAAARKTLERRLMGNPNAKEEEKGNRYQSYGSYLNGESFGGWQSVWISMMWLRLGEPNEAYRHHQYQLKNGMTPNFFGWAAQLDGTFGSTAVIAEMLLQSHTDFISLLPALPTRWPTGSVTGLRARGGFAINMEWKNNKLKEATLVSHNGGLCTLKVKNNIKIIEKGKEIQVTKNPENEIVFNTQKGGVYKIVGY